MAEGRSNGSGPELVYLTEPSWYPPLVAIGLAAVIASIFTWWPYGAIGGAVALVALIMWARQARSSYDVLPREQNVTVGTIPPSPLRRPK
jgi:hypothetical protein